jgi:hypothetical protein
MKYIDTIVPIPIDQIKEYFKDKEIKFIIDYNNSKLQEKVFLTYIANLDVPCDINLNKKIEKEKLFQLLISYMSVKSVSNIEFLNVCMAQIILSAVGMNYKSIFTKYILTEEECEEFISKNENQIAKWIHFLDSTMIFLIKSFEDLNEKIKVKDNFKNIDDSDYVGLNIVNLLSIPGFLECYFSAPRKISMDYFVQQFESHMFKGKSLYQYYFNEENIFVPILKQMINKEIPINADDLFTEKK